MRIVSRSYNNSGDEVCLHSELMIALFPDSPTHKVTKSWGVGLKARLIRWSVENC